MIDAERLLLWIDAEVANLIYDTDNMSAAEQEQNRLIAEGMQMVAAQVTRMAKKVPA